MRTAWIVTLTLLLVALIPMWPYPDPWSMASVFGGVLAVLLLVIAHTMITRPHHWPH